MWCSVSALTTSRIDSSSDMDTTTHLLRRLPQSILTGDSAAQLLRRVNPLCELLMHPYSSLDVQFWTTSGTKLRHAFITFASPDGATTALKSYTPPSWWSDRRRTLVRYMSHFLNRPRRWVLTKFSIRRSNRSLGSTTLRISESITPYFNRVRVRKSPHVVRH
jgi:hypothetical protein